MVGCAKTVTLKETAGSQITVSITFSAPPSFLNIDYYMIVGNQTFNLNDSLSSNYFFIPGQTFNPTAVDTISNGNGLQHIYDNYFSTWGTVLTLKANDLTLTKGPFSSTTSTAQDHYNYSSSFQSLSSYSVANNTISFTIPLSDLGITGKELYYSFVTRIGDEVLNTQDLVSSIQSIDLIANSPPQTNRNDTSLFSPEPAAKIVSWTLTVQ